MQHAIFISDFQTTVITFAFFVILSLICCNLVSLFLFSFTKVLCFGEPVQLAVNCVGVCSSCGNMIHTQTHTHSHTLSWSYVGCSLRFFWPLRFTHLTGSNWKLKLILVIRDTGAGLLLICICVFFCSVHNRFHWSFVVVVVAVASSFS